MNSKREQPQSRGSTWHYWEPHIHAPGTLHEDRYDGSEDLEDYLQKLENLTPVPSAIGITEYCVTETYERVREQKSLGRLENCNCLFANIELRLDIGTTKGYFVNIHLLVCPDDENHIAETNKFLSKLEFSAFDDTFSCTPTELIRLGRKHDSALDERAALRKGAMQFKIAREKLVDIHQRNAWARDNILIAVSGNADGTSGVKEAADQTLRQEIESCAHAIFTGNPKQREFWLGNSSKITVEKLHERYNGQKPCIWGCDAHEYSKIGNPDGDRYCWIKGVPSFDTLRQACIDPERAFVGAQPPSGASPSQVIDHLVIKNADWARTNRLNFNPGLVAIIGARGSGKTALADMIAAGCHAFEDQPDSPSFLKKAKEKFQDDSIELAWADNSDTAHVLLSHPVGRGSDSYPRARYLSQQFVEYLCSNEGMPELLKEIQRVIFNSHTTLERDAALDFEELLDVRTHAYRDARNREETALANLSDEIGAELEKAKKVESLTKKVTEKEIKIRRYEADQKALMPKNPSTASTRLAQLMEAVEPKRQALRNFKFQETSLKNLEGDISEVRNNMAPAHLRDLEKKHEKTSLQEAEWSRFLLDFSGQVDETVNEHSTKISKKIEELKGDKPTESGDVSVAFIEDDADLRKVSLELLEAEISRLQAVVTSDKVSAKKLQTVSRNIQTENAALERIREELVDCKGASDRARELVEERREGYERVFDALLSEERVLKELYSPLVDRLKDYEGTLRNLSFAVRRVADVEKWSEHAENSLFDRRGGPFKGKGTLTEIAEEKLKAAWQTGTKEEVSEAMTAFRDTYEKELLERAPYQDAKSQEYREWARRFAKWLYGTSHIKIEYGVLYNGVDIRKLSPGTRGIVLVLLYLALDDEDERPLIIDQPEDNLDPKSIFDELVPLFHLSKQRRQVFLVTHNANLVVNTNADQIIIADAEPHEVDGLPPISYETGGLDEAHIWKQVRKILEGGKNAFRDRARRLRISLPRRHPDDK
ncbi:TrlF family AAA-like ATPase [uncultured Roseobacter sp.]|uniref:TrlF family AAA-like ATPase n=1 Tax=uncultured Roseobacter sp. TaxID=114847 RepID=UPI0026225FFD|nr:AAA family ATPase [uncultured Roseobacter sp.]